jgi:hypothetical protein
MEHFFNFSPHRGDWLVEKKYLFSSVPSESLVIRRLYLIIPGFMGYLKLHPYYAKPLADF